MKRCQVSAVIFFVRPPIKVVHATKTYLILPISHYLFHCLDAEVLLGGCRLLNLDPEKAVVDGVDDVEI